MNNFDLTLPGLQGRIHSVNIFNHWRAAIMRNILITLMIFTWSVNARAEEFNYQANVEAMVCAFCAYSVGKKISSLPGVEANSVHLRLYQQ